jgi:hypothetical protein
VIKCFVSSFFVEQKAAVARRFLDNCYCQTVSQTSLPLPHRPLSLSPSFFALIHFLLLSRTRSHHHHRQTDHYHRMTLRQISLANRRMFPLSAPNPPRTLTHSLTHSLTHLLTYSPQGSSASLILCRPPTCDQTLLFCLVRLSFLFKLIAPLFVPNHGSLIG